MWKWVNVENAQRKARLEGFTLEEKGFRTKKRMFQEKARRCPKSTIGNLFHLQEVGPLGK